MPPRCQDMDDLRTHVPGALSHLRIALGLRAIRSVPIPAIQFLVRFQAWSVSSQGETLGCCGLMCCHGSADCGCDYSLVDFGDVGRGVQGLNDAGSRTDRDTMLVEQ
jgi:hypothetical protein